MNSFLLFMEQEDTFFLFFAVDFDRIDEAEQTLQLVFADDYKEYVNTFGAATFDGHELTGICHSNRLSVIFTTERARKYYPNFPKNMYVVEELFFDHILIVQDSTGAIYSYGPNDKATKTAESLLEYYFPNYYDKNCLEKNNNKNADNTEVI